ncbi:MAG TPA: MFS transporter [Candidatus Deferrimicrobium sp.]|nr:MFS transporter [Candidatus Deferrimicrobium sp.]
MSPDVSKDFWITSFLPFSAAMAASGTLIPLFILFIGGSVSDIGMLSALSSIISLPLAFIWGKLTDDTGKRKIFILIMLISGFGILLGYFFASTFPDYLWLILLSVMAGLLLGAGDTAKNMYIFDKYPTEEWEETISKYSQRSGIGSCIGMVFGGLFQMFFNNYAIFFLICAILCGVSAILGFFTIKDIKKDKISEYKFEKSPIINADLPMYSSVLQIRRPISYKVAPKDAPMKSQITKGLVMFFIAGFALFLASNLTFTPLAAYISQDLAIPESWIFWIFLGYYMISVVGYTFAGNLIDKQGNRKILFIGLIIRIGVYVAFTIFTFFIITMIGSFITVIILLVFSGISYSLMNVALQNTLPRMVQKNVGEVLALYSIIVGISAIIGSFFSGFIAQSLGYFWLFLFSIIFAVIAGLIYLKGLDKN